MPAFFLELFSEEIPARMQDKARADLARLFEEQMDAAGLKAAAVTTYATPRRLVRALVADLGTVALLATLGGLILGSRAVYIADTYLRNPLAGKPALTMQLAPVAVVAVTLLLVMVAGTAVPIRRMLRQDVVRSIQGDAG